MDEGARYYLLFLQGDADAFEQLMRLYHDRLIFFIDRYVQDYAAAEDLAEDTFVELLVHKRRFDFRYPLKTYLYAIARNKALNYLKYRKRRKAEDIDQCFDLADDSIPLEQALLQDERHRQVNRVLQTLSADYRTVVHLLYFEELSYAQAAKVMGKNSKQIENLAYRARAAIRAALKKEELPDENV